MGHAMGAGTADVRLVFPERGAVEPCAVVDATGNAEVFRSALALAGRYGTVVLLGDTGHPGAQRLSSEVMTKGLTVTAVHDTHDRPGWDEPRLLRYVLGMMERGLLDCSGLITHRFSWRDAPEAYRLVNDRRGETMGVAFLWDGAGSGDGA
ncbi:hypothetical protein N5079_08360 [Planotetraspora sp. A-T 1434]|uniref:hypothetical protein n=1 Tax=Planotetraspora sp. A-T 1434 TaxID=2979219 RepID=UPI0021BEF5EC|nr:hypothetical protein [Planotetraspora sp. A-T 1434]MCT9930238.1 hypothetical protein [Planotetraspora sp. A-T 1434]